MAKPSGSHPDLAITCKVGRPSNPMYFVTLPTTTTTPTLNIMYTENWVILPLRYTNSPHKLWSCCTKVHQIFTRCRENIHSVYAPICNLILLSVVEYKLEEWAWFCQFCLLWTWALITGGTSPPQNLEWGDANANCPPPHNLSCFKI